MAVAFRHYLTYQHNVQRYFRDHCDRYHGVIVPLSIATAFPSGTYGFVRALCARHKDKQYAIDPRNALFQKSWNRANVREPHRRMANALGGPFADKGLAGALSPDDFKSDAVVSEVVDNCLRYQRSFQTCAEDERKLKKYKTLLGLSSMAELGDPQFLIPPYFQFDGFADPWYEVSRRCIEKAVTVDNRVPIRPVFHFQRWKEMNDWTDCHKVLAGSGISSFWYYPNNFKEHDASEAELMSYRQGVAEATERAFETFSLFGGYFCVLLSYFGLRGFGNGIGYGEWRDSGYHRGGTAATRVYVLKIHRFLDAPAAGDLIEKDQGYFGRDTEVLSACLDGGGAISEISQDECLDHFLECRQLEMEFAASHSRDEGIAELRETVERLERIGPLEAKKYGASLKRWAAALS